MEILETFRKIESNQSAADSLSNILANATTELGYRYYSFLSPQSTKQPISRSPRPIFLTNYPSEWRQRYLKKCYHFIDPVVIEGKRSTSPYLWGGNQYIRTLHAKQRIFFAEARAFGIVFGLTIPIYGPDGECSLFSVSSDLNAFMFQELINETTASIQLLALQAHTVAAEYLVETLDKNPETPLTDRERECLLWTAQGKTSWEISQIIGRSTATVNYHLQKSMRKLEACNKVQAAFKAYECKLLV